MQLASSSVSQELRFDNAPKWQRVGGKRAIVVAVSAFALLLMAIVIVLLVPPVRDRFFATTLWPWALPWDVSEQEMSQLSHLSRPGDVIVEANLHCPQWIALSKLTTGANWVHASLVDESKGLITVEREAMRAPLNVYKKWRSTRLALVRPPYRNQEQVRKVIAYAESKLGTPYDPSFNNPAGTCTGLVGIALAHEGVPVQSQNCFGRQIYAPDCFFKIPGARIIWTSDRHRLPQQTSPAAAADAHAH